MRWRPPTRRSPPSTPNRNRPSHRGSLHEEGGLRWLVPVQRAARRARGARGVHLRPRHIVFESIPRSPRRAVLDPLDRSSEVLFGLVMALTFTTTLEIATAGAADVRTMLAGALGCNIAWGIVD